MKFFRDTDSLPGAPRQTVMTIGNFDGVHRGHQMIVRELVARAQAMGGTPVLMTFDPPPARVLGKGEAPRICSLADRAALIEALGVEVFVCQTFTPALAEMAAEDFIEQVLEARLDPRVIIIGYDFCFGRDRRGDFRFLEAYFNPRGVEVVQLGPLTLGPAGGGKEEIISSSAIRRHISAGEVRLAEHMLGRPHFIRGQVVPGDARGRTLGFPTANLESQAELLPATGVYACRVTWEGRRFNAVANLGYRPTLGGTEQRIEAHLLEFEGDLYGATLKLEFLDRLRGELRFPGLEALQAQIARDVAHARQLAAERDAGSGRRETA